MYAPIAAPVCAGPGSWRGARLAGLSIQLSAVVQRGNPAPLIAPCSRPDNHGAFGRASALSCSRLLRSGLARSPRVPSTAHV